MENIAETEQYFRFSKYCYPYQRDDVLAVFHALNVNVAYLARHNNVVADHLINRRNFLLSELAPDEREIAENLLGIGMVIPEQEDEEVILEKIRTEQTGTPAIGILYLLLTETCNLACTYCFIEGAIPPGYAFTRMSPETAEAAIDLFARTLNPDNRPSIIFYGGEPLVNWKTLVHAVLYIETKISDGILPDNTEISIITNATLLTDSRIKFFKEHNIGVSISLDGPASNNDARIFHNHRKSIDSVMRAYHKLRQNGMSFGISCTLNSHNVANIEAITQWFCDEKVDAVGFNILMDIPGNPANPELILESSQALTKAYEKLRTHGIYEDRVGRKVEDFSNQQLHLFDCGGYGGQLVIAPDGALGVCHAYLGERKHFVTNVHSAHDFDPANDPTFIEWSRRSPVNMPQCANCPAIGICGGGCAKNAEMSHGTIWELDERFCIHAKLTLEWMMWDLFDIASSKSDEDIN